MKYTLIKIDILSFFMPLFALVSLTACSNISLEESKQLARAGQTASLKARDFVDLTKNNIDPLITNEYFGGYINVNSINSCESNILSAPNEEKNKIYANTKKEIQLVSDLFSNFRDIYIEFENLSNFDSSKNIDDSFTKLAENLNDLPTGKGTESGKPDVATGRLGVASGIFGWISDEARKEQLKKASALIRQALEKTKEAFSKRSETFSTYPKKYITSQYAISEVLWKCGYLDAKPFVKRYAIPDMLVTSEKASFGSDRNENFKNAIKGLLLLKTEADQNDIETLFKNTEKSLDELIKEHEKFEAGSPINLSQVRDNIARMQAILDRLNQK